MRPKGTGEELKRRRLQAIEYLEAGFGPTEIARILLCSRTSVYRWQETYEEEGKKGMEPKPTPGRPSRLTARQKERFRKAVLRGAVAAGYRTEIWTTKRLAQVIEKMFGIRYHRNHVGKIMDALGFSCQKPDRRARERDEARIAHWKRYRWSAIKKKRRR